MIKWTERLPLYEERVFISGEERVSIGYLEKTDKTRKCFFR